jgi:hypothetical protein
MPRDKHAVQNHNIYIGNKSLERVEHFKYLRTSLSNQNSVHEEIKVSCNQGIIIIIIGSTALGGPWPHQANVTSILYPGHLPANFYNPVSLCLLPPCQSILISVGHILGNLQSLSAVSF